MAKTKNVNKQETSNELVININNKVKISDYSNKGIIKHRDACKLVNSMFSILGICGCIIDYDHDENDSPFIKLIFDKNNLTHMIGDIRIFTDNDKPTVELSNILKKYTKTRLKRGTIAHQENLIYFKLDLALVFDDIFEDFHSLNMYVASKYPLDHTKELMLEISKKGSEPQIYGVYIK